MTAKPSGLPGLSRTVAGREVIVQDFVPSLEPAFRALIPFVNMAVDAGFFTGDEANLVGNEQAKSIISQQLTYYLAWTGLKDDITPDDLNSLIEEVTNSAGVYLTKLTESFHEQMQAAAQEADEEDSDD